MGEGTSLSDFRRNGRNGAISQIIDPVTGRFHSPLTPLERFAAKCRFDPVTGCVVWTGGKSNGGGRYVQGYYGVFKDAGRRWFAHRWAAAHIHRFGIDGLTVDHWCPHTADGHPNPLCVEHVRPLTIGENVAARNARRGLAAQSPEERRFWLFVDRGIEPAPEIAVEDPAGVPWFEPPAWFKPFMKGVDSDACPF